MQEAIWHLCQSAF